MSITYIPNPNYTKNGLDITITARDTEQNKQVPVVLKGNLLSNPFAPKAVSTGTVCNFRVAANFNVNTDSVLMGTIIEAINDVYAFYGLTAPVFNGYIPVSMGAWDNEATYTYSNLGRGDFVKMTGDIKIRMYQDKDGIRHLDVHMGNEAKYAILKKAIKPEALAV